MKYELETVAPSQPRYDIERDLNADQRAVVEAPAGRLLVIAGAGTGKTRTLMYRMAHLIERGAAPERILLCTFTHRAARELLGRVEELLGLDIRRCTAGTFHQIGNKILRRHGHAIGLAPDFGILDNEDARTMLAGIITELGLKTLSARRFPPAKVLHDLIGTAMGTQTPLESLLRSRTPSWAPEWPVILDVVERFTNRKRRANVCDFDDLLGLWHRLLFDPSVANTGMALREGYDHVLIDEYQDINALQGALCDGMSELSGSLTCVGDDAQSIYGFRGADFGQIADFSHRHPNAAVHKLTTNYRSSPEILNLANRSIAFNETGHPKTLRAAKPTGLFPAVVPLRDVFQQAEFVAQRVLELHHPQTLPLADIAVLYRDHAHSLELQVELRRRQIPYAVRSGVRFFEQAHIKDAIAFLRVRENVHDDLAWLQVLRRWSGVQRNTAESIASRLSGTDHTQSEGKSMEAVETRLAVHRQLLALAPAMPPRTRANLEKLAALWTRLLDEDHRSPGAAIREIIRMNDDDAERTFAAPNYHREDLERLATYAERFCCPSDFLADLAWVQGLPLDHAGPSKPVDDELILSTVHQAKGLEWPVCFVLGLSEGRFPSSRAATSPTEIEEERRLFYVAVTRAKSELYMCYPTIDTYDDTSESGSAGQDGRSRLLRPSRFLRELDYGPPVFDRWQISEEPLSET